MRSFHLFGLAVACLISTQSYARAAIGAPLIPRADLFGNPAKFSSVISPDGKVLSWIAPVDGVPNLWVAPSNRLEAGKPITRETGRGISPVQTWTYDSRHILYLQDSNGSGNLHLYLVDAAKGGTKDLTPFGHVRATIVALSARRPNEILISLNRRDPKYGDIYRVNLRTGALTLVSQNPGFTSFLADDRFNLLLAVKIEPTNTETVLRWSQGVWKPWTVIPTEDLRTTSLLALDRTRQSVFALDSRGRDTSALVRIDLATGRKSVIAQDPRSDIQDVIFDQNTHKPLAYSVNVARLEHGAVDPKTKKDLDFLSKQDLGDWTVNSRSRDNRFWKMTVFEDSQQMLAALYDRQKKAVHLLYNTRPALAAAPLVPMHPATIKARDGLDLVSYLSLPLDSDARRTGTPDTPLPLVLLVHGGPHDRDVFGFNPLHQLLANRGYAVLSVNMRGSTGFGKSFANGSVGEWGRKLDDDLLDAVAWAISRKIADPARVAIMGASFGGYAALTGLTRDPDTYACGVDMFGPSNLPDLQRTQSPFLAASSYHFEFGNPDTAEGQALTKEQSPLNYAGRIKKPLLIAQGANDPSVNREQSDRMAEAATAAGAPVTYLLYPDEGHGFARAENNLSFYAVAEQFLANCLGGRAEQITADSIKGSSMQVLEGGDQLAGLKAAVAMRDGASVMSPIR